MPNRPVTSTRTSLRRALIVAAVCATAPAIGTLATAALATTALATAAPATATLATAAPATALEALPAAGTQRASTTATPRDSLRVYHLTFGPGAAVWERFGHNALWIHDPVARSDVAYHYGLFDMSEDGFLLHFLQGRMWYSMGTAPAGWTIEAYRRVGRDVTVQELRLSPDQVRRLQDFLEWNMRPENRVYRYDYFRDNCSTRIRDALDRVMDGALQEELSRRPSPVTYRGQAVALTAEDELLTTGMDFGLGPLADQPITRWELAFIPMRLSDDLRDMTIEREGRTVPLVVSERHLPAIRVGEPDLAVPPSETSPPTRAPGLLLLGVLIGGIMVGAGELTRRERTSGRTRSAARWILAASGTLWALLTGVLGTVLLALWTLTDHEFAWRNENLFQANPLALALVVLIPLAVIGGRRRDGARVVALVLASLSMLGLLVHPLPLTPQSNLPVIALALPIHLGLAWALRAASRDEPTA